MTIFHGISRIISQTLKVDPKLISLEAELAGDLGGAPLTLIELFFRTEDDFLIDISAEKARAVVTVQDLHDLVESYQRL